MGVLCVLAVGCGRLVEGQPVAPAREGDDRSLIVAYFERSNAAARGGPAAQAEFLARTQHPDVARQCDLGALTVLLEPSLSTLRPDDGWRPARADRTPRGAVYLIAVTVTVQRDGATVGTQVGSMHVVVLDAAVYGFAPCPT